MYALTYYPYPKARRNAGRVVAGLASFMGRCVRLRLQRSTVGYIIREYERMLVGARLLTGIMWDSV